MSLAIDAASSSLYRDSSAIMALASPQSSASSAIAAASNPVDTVSLSAAAVAQQSGTAPTQFASATDAAGAASQAICCLQVCLSGLQSDKESLQPDVIASLRQSFGDKGVDGFIASTKQDMMANQSQIASWSAYIQTNYQVTGSVLSKDDAGDDTLGSFTLSYQGTSEGMSFAMKGSSSGSFQVTDAKGNWRNWSLQSSSGSSGAETLSGAAIALASLKGINKVV